MFVQIEFPFDVPEYDIRAGDVATINGETGKIELVRTAPDGVRDFVAENVMRLHQIGPRRFPAPVIAAVLRAHAPTARERRHLRLA